MTLCAQREAIPLARRRIPRGERNRLLEFTLCRFPVPFVIRLDGRERGTRFSEARLDLERADGRCPRGRHAAGRRGEQERSQGEVRIGDPGECEGERSEAHTSEL